MFDARIYQHLTDDQRAAGKPWAIAGMVTKVLASISYIAALCFSIFGGDTRIVVTWFVGTVILNRGLMRFFVYHVDCAAGITPPPGFLWSWFWDPLILVAMGLALYTTWFWW